MYKKQHDLFMMIDGQPEFNVCNRIDNLAYLGTESSPVLTNNYQDGNGTDGNLFTTAQFGKNTINVHFKLHVKNYYDYQSKRDEIYNLFVQKKIFRLRFPEDMNNVVFVRPIGFDITPFQRAGYDCDIIIPFENPSGYKFSRYDSQNQLDLWDDFPLGWDIPAVTKDDFHIVNQPEFDLINPSSMAIDPYMQRHDLKVVMTYVGSRISIINAENDSVFTFLGENNLNRTIVLDGVNAFENHTNVNDSTNFGYLKLEEGMNHISVRGCEKFDIKFVFPFIYV